MRKIVFAAVAIASVAIALAPSLADARMLHHRHYHMGRSHHRHI